MKFLLKNKTRILIFLFIIPLLFSLIVQYHENIKKYDYWNYKVLKEFTVNGVSIVTKEEINSLNNEDAAKHENAVIKLKEDKKEIIRNFLPTSTEYRNWNCYKKFNTNTDGTMDIIINSLGILQLGKINDECFSDESKQILFVSYLFIYFAIFFTIIVLFADKVRRLIPYKNHIAIIGLNKYSREIIKQLSEEKNIKIYDNDTSNKYINELENSGEIIITGKLEYTIESNNCEIINVKEIYIINDSDAESLNNLALILNKFDNAKNRKIKNKTKIYIEIKNRENKAFFDKKGIYDLMSNCYEIYPFSINEIIVQEIFKDKPLISNIKKEKNRYIENLKILIVGFNDLSEEILYNILKLGHFDIDKITEVTVIDDKYKMLSSKYKKIIEKGKKPYENSNEILWNIEFLPYKSLYENIDFNRIILCDKELNNGIDILNYINNNYHVQIKEKNTIIQVFNEHKNINNTINSNKNNFKNFSTFGDIETTVTLNNIQNNNLYKVAEYTNDFKENKEFKKWKNIDAFTIESNITDKLHINIKLHGFGLAVKNRENLEMIDVIEKYIAENNKLFEKKNKPKILQDLYEVFKLPYILEIFEDFENFKNLEDVHKESNNGIEFYEKIKDKLEYFQKSKTFVSKEEIKVLESTINKYKIIEEKGKIEHIKEDYYRIKNYIELSKKISEFKFSKKSQENWSKLQNILKEIESMTEKEYLIFVNKNREKLNSYFNSIVEEIKESSQLLKLIILEKEEFKISEHNMKIAFVYAFLNFYLKIKDKPNYVEIIHRLAEIEHTRWNAYHILNGWTRREEKGKDMIKKEHFDLCNWKTLNKEDLGKVKYDYESIYQIPFVAYCLGLEIVEI